MRAQFKNILFLSTLLVLISVRAQAAAVIVDDADGTNGACTLADAVTAANTDADAGGCVATGVYGDDTITLATDILLSAALPSITGTITIDGQRHIIDGNDGDWSVLTVVSKGNLILNRTTVTGGKSTEFGGGIYAYDATVTLTHSTVSGNSAGYGGGGIYVISSTVTLNSSAVSGNSVGAGSDGGGIHADSSTVTLNASLVSGNSAGLSGGGILAYSLSTVTLNSSTVSGNSAGLDAGGIYAGETKLTLNSSTVSGNSAEYNAGGIYTDRATATLNSCLVTGNTASRGKEIYNDGSTVDAAGFNLFGHGSESGGDAFVAFTPGDRDVNATADGTNTPLASILDPILADNGGPTQTHALPADSPAIDLDAICRTNLTEDQRGYTRPGASDCDTGAFEYDDSDGDGIESGSDNCPAAPNADQQDTDGDGIGDVCEPVNMVPVYYIMLLR